MNRNIYLHIYTISLIIASFIILFFIFEEKYFIFIFAMLAAVSVVIYSFPPTALQNRGFSELIVFIAFGPLITAGIAYILTDRIEFNHFLIGFPFGFLASLVLWTNEISDLSDDKKIMKRTLLLRVKAKNSYIGFFIISLLYICSGIFLSISGIIPLAELILFLISIPILVYFMLIIKSKWNKAKQIFIIQKKMLLFQVLSSAIIILLLLF